MSTLDSNETLAALVKFGFPFDLQRRNLGAPHALVDKSSRWPAPWRARLRPTKNERQNYRLTAFGDTASEACSALLTMVTIATQMERHRIREENQLRKAQEATKDARLMKPMGALVLEAGKDEP